MPTATVISITDREIIRDRITFKHWQKIEEIEERSIIGAGLVAGRLFEDILEYSEHFTCTHCGSYNPLSKQYDMCYSCRKRNQSKL